MKICVKGLGYIGLPTSAVFCQSGADVIGVDPKQSTIDSLNRGIIPIEEPGLDVCIQTAIQEGRFHAVTTDVAADVYIIAVPTPHKEDAYKSCDLTYVLQACRDILPMVRKGNVIIIESTIAPTSIDLLIKPLFEEQGFTIGTDLYLAHCPERVLPGQILHELVYNNRIVGGVTPACTEKAAAVYATVVKGEIIKTSAKTAEMSKCMENTYRDVNIALANELAKICFELDIDCLDVIQMANKHPRVNILTPGPGVGGHCLAIDPYFIYAKAPKQAKLIKLARDINNSMPQYVVDRVADLVPAGAVIAAYGVTYKANVDDVRESPALQIIELLQQQGYTVRICDPHVKNSSYFDCVQAAKGAELALVLVDHHEFKELDWTQAASQMKKPLIFDTRGFIDPQTAGVVVLHYGNIKNHIN